MFRRLLDLDLVYVGVDSRDQGTLSGLDDGLFLHPRRPLLSLSYALLAYVRSKVNARCSSSCRIGGQVYGVAFFAFASSTVIGFLMSTLAVDLLTYSGIFYMFAGLSCVSMILLLFFKETPWKPRVKA